MRIAWPSVFGDGLLERARSTSFALLGLTAAFGLAIVALVINQDWPEVAVSPIPRPPAAAVHDQVLVEKPSTPARGSSSPSAPASVAPPVREAVGDAPSYSAPEPREVVSVPTPPPPSDDRRRSPQPDRQQGAPPVTQPSPPSPVASPVSAPAQGTPDAPPPPPPEAVASSHPGQGHAYGKGNGNGPPGGVPPGQAGK